MASPSQHRGSWCHLEPQAREELFSHLCLDVRPSPAAGIFGPYTQRGLFVLSFCKVGLWFPKSPGSLFNAGAFKSSFWSASVFTFCLLPYQNKKSGILCARARVHRHTKVKKTHSPSFGVHLSAQGRVQWLPGTLPGFTRIYTFSLSRETGDRCISEISETQMDCSSHACFAVCLTVSIGYG